MRSGIIIFLTFFLFGGCSYLRFQQPLRSTSDDWTMYGGGIGRTNVAHASVEPPLTFQWEYDASAGFSPYSVAVVDDYLFVGNLQGEIHVINVVTGKGVGNYDFGTAVVGTPVVDGTTLYVALAHDEESLLAYNMISGTVEWRAKLGDIETSPLLIGKRLFVTTLSGKLVCIESNTGEVVWTYKVPPNVRTTNVRSSPASDGKIIVFGCDNGELYAVNVDDGTLSWKARTGGSIMASPSINLGKVFIGSLDGTFYSFDVETGTQAWKQSLAAKIYSSQAVGQKYVFVGSVAGDVFCLDAATGNVVWKAATENVVNSSPLISGDVVYVGCLDKTLYAYLGATGEILWKYKAEGRIKTMPVASRGRLFLLTEDRSVIAFKPSSN